MFFFWIFFLIFPTVLFKSTEHNWASDLVRQSSCSQLFATESVNLALVKYDLNFICKLEKTMEYDI